MFQPERRNNPKVEISQLYGDTEPAVPVDWYGLLAEQNAPSDWQRRLAEVIKSTISSHAQSAQIMNALSEAQAKFDRLLKKYGIDNIESNVHLNEDVVAQCFASMLAVTTHEDRVNAAVIAMATHLLDDQLDPPDKVANRALFEQHRDDIRGFLDQWGTFGDFSHKVAEFSRWSDGFYRGLHRMFYGALVSQGDYESQQRYLAEYRQLSFKPLSPYFINEIKNIRALCLTYTTKTVCETIPLAGAEDDYDAAELRSLGFAPMLLLVDLPGEVACNEMQQFGNAPKVEELVEMVDCANRLLTTTPMNYELYQQQLKFAVDAFGMMLPIEVLDAYDRLDNKLNELMRAMNQNVVLVDLDNNPTGEVVNKMETHRKALLHSAFSVFVLTEDGDLILQQRADSKYHSGGLWTNTCCGHPGQGEDVKLAAERRLFHELGIICSLKERFVFHYHEPVPHGLFENEIDTVFTGIATHSLRPDLTEVKDIKIVSIEEALRMIEELPEAFTAWFKIALPRLVELIRKEEGVERI